MGGGPHMQIKTMIKYLELADAAIARPIGCAS